MFNPLGSFSVHTFALQPTAQETKNTPVSYPVTSFQNLGASSSQAPVAGPSRHANSHLVTQDAGPSSPPLASQRKRTPGEIQIMKETAAGFTTCLTADQVAVLYPDVDTPFTDIFDAVNRLLPYHILQQPEEDLDNITRSKSPKGKEKASPLQNEIMETKFALECHRRYKALQDRFRRARLRSGKRDSPDGQAYVVAQYALEAERAETTAVSNELRNARNELDALQREKRVSNSSVPRPSYYPQPSQAQYYRTYPYAYTQPYNVSAQGATTSMFYATTPVAQTTSYTPGTGFIPVQLPVTSLSALHALGIVPIPAASLPPPDQPQPPAVLRGSTANGTMLSLEINVSLLQSAQMSGLAFLLNSATSRGGTSGIPTPSQPSVGSQAIQSSPNPQQQISNSPSSGTG
ncbi:hypothetical protein BJ138DRAFT_1089668 [Hygrophoropsis aurantiaca]|uniref:Uncharacterized protein n=1 Tax=Hygrophoropsis aurantiaca TaxID=72124 RepID=A0ACB8A777_9AGAM|nr:hypothetical protein BJ138DRAFT_1089668 [Hygrophoropsis aurantiaca]